MEKQVKSKKRVADYGEVYTARKQVTDMVDLVHDEISSAFATVLEPACGNGNFLAEILERKLATIKSTPYNNTCMEQYALQAISSIYGVDIQEDNTLECRERLHKQLLKSGLIKSIPAAIMAEKILKQNIICGDTLTMQTNLGKPISFSEWDIQKNGTALRKDVLLKDMIEGGGQSNRYTYRKTYCWMPQQVG